MIGRLRALGRIYQLVARAGWDEVSLDDLVTAELADYGIAREGRVAIEGPPVRLRIKATVAIGMLLHDLAENALRKGGLSVPQGRLQLTWSIEQPEKPDARLVIHWRETDGPEHSSAIEAALDGPTLSRRLKEEIEASAEIRFGDRGIEADIAVSFASGSVVLLAASPEGRAGADHAPEDSS